MAGAAPIVKRFREIYPSSSDPQIWRAPGRVNLIGEHTDYNLGFVLPMAIDLECIVASAPTHDGWLRVYSEQLGQGSQWRIQDLAGASPRGDWSDRVAGVAWELSRRGTAIASQNVFITSSIPIGGGLSSSAALGVALALAFGGTLDPRVAQSAEVDFVGVPCGIMDQFASARGGVNMLDCRSLESTPVTLPEELAIVTVNSMVKHELGDSAYRTRVAECAAAARALSVASLRDATLKDLAKLDGVLLKRARHVITENLRVQAFRNAGIEEMGRLATESHLSLRDDYEVSCPELDALVEMALAIPGVVGARMTGGGFGGSTVNFVRRETIGDFLWTMAQRYPEIHVCAAAPGASKFC